MLKKVFNHKVVRNFSYLTFGSTLSQLIGIFTIMKITRLFSPSDYGTYTFIMSQGTLLFTIADFGITNIIIRTIARNKEKTADLVVNGAIVRFVAVVILTSLYLLYNYYLGNLTVTQLLLVGSFALVNCFTHLFEIAFLGHEKMLPISLINLFYSLAWFGSVYLLPARNVNVTYLFSIFLIVNLVKAVISVTVLKNLQLLTGKVQSVIVSSKELVKESWPYFSLVLILLPVNYLSSNFLELNSKIVEVGYFNLAQKLLSPVNLVLGFALSAIFPNLSSLWIKDEKRFYQLTSIGFKYFMLIALLMCFLFTLFVREIVLLLFKSNYLPAVRVCQLQVWFDFLMAVFSLIGTILGAVNKEKLIFKLGLINAVIATPMLYYGSKYGALGLSYAYVISFALFGLYNYPAFLKTLDIKISHDKLLWGMSAILFCISYFIPMENTFILRLGLGVVAITCAALYFKFNYKTILMA